MAPDTPRSCPTCETPVPAGADVCPRCGMPGASSRGAGDAFAALLAAVLVDVPDVGAVEGAGEEARRVYVAELAESYELDGRVEARGPELRSVWFFLPEEPDRRCGSVPTTDVRRRLADLGFERVVVSDRSPAGSVCSFGP